MAKRSDRFYVYVYTDPDTHRPFYIGKGEGYRVRDHLKFGKPKNEKQRKLQELFAEHRNPIVEIVQWGLSSREAEKTEAAMIEYFGLKHLSNRQSGRGTEKINADFLEYILRDEKLKENRNGTDVAVIKVGEGYRPGMSRFELYDLVRSSWRATNIEEIEECDTVLVVLNKWVIDVYKFPVWEEAGATARMSREEVVDGEYEFTAKFALPATRNRYIGKRIAFKLIDGCVKVTKVK